MEDNTYITPERWCEVLVDVMEKCKAATAEDKAPHFWFGVTDQGVFLVFAITDNIGFILHARDSTPSMETCLKLKETLGANSGANLRELGVNLSQLVNDHGFNID